MSRIVFKDKLEKSQPVIGQIDLDYAPALDSTSAVKIQWFADWTLEARTYLGTEFGLIRRLRKNQRNLGAYVPSWFAKRMELGREN